MKCPHFCASLDKSERLEIEQTATRVEFVDHIGEKSTPVTLCVCRYCGTVFGDSPYIYGVPQ